MASWSCIRIVPALACCLRAPNYYLNQCWLVVHRSLSNKLQRNFNSNAKISMQKYVFCKISSILLKCQCGNHCVAHMPVSMHWHGTEWCYSYTKSEQLLWVTQRHVSIMLASYYGLFRYSTQIHVGLICMFNPWLRKCTSHNTLAQALSTNWPRGFKGSSQLTPMHTHASHI